MEKEREREREREKGRNRDGVTGDQAFPSAWVGKERKRKRICCMFVVCMLYVCLYVSHTLHILYIYFT